MNIFVVIQYHRLNRSMTSWNFHASNPQPSGAWKCQIPNANRRHSGLPQKPSAFLISFPSRAVEGVAFELFNHFYGHGSKSIERESTISSTFCGVGCLWQSTLQIHPHASEVQRKSFPPYSTSVVIKNCLITNLLLIWWSNRKDVETNEREANEIFNKFLIAWETEAQASMSICVVHGFKFFFVRVVEMKKIDFPAPTRNSSFPFVRLFLLVVRINDKFPGKPSRCNVAQSRLC